MVQFRKIGQIFNDFRYQDKRGKDIMKKLILVTSPPACGKTFVTKKLAKAMPNCVYLDKDSLIVLSKQIGIQ